MNNNVRILKSGAIIFVLMIVGKAISLGREMVFSAMFGTSLYADAYFAANIVPSLLNIPLTISSLVFFIPIYKKLQIDHEADKASRFTSNIITIYVLFNIMLSILTCIFARPLLTILASGFDSTTFEYTVILTRLLVFSFPITIIAHVYINVSNAHQKHINPQLVTIVNSLLSMILIWILAPLYGIYVVPVIGLFAWVVQVLFQKYFVNDIYKYRFTLDLADKNLKQMIYLALPVIIATAADQINLSINSLICASLDSGSVSLINYAQKIFNLINGTLTTAIITVSYPVFSALYASQKLQEFKNTIDQCFSIIALIMLPITAFCLIGSIEMVQVIFFRGAFTFENVINVAKIFLLYSIGLPFIAMKELYTRVFYIMGDSKTPTIVNVGCILLNICLSLILVRNMGITGLSLAASSSWIIACLAEGIIIKSKFKNIDSYSFFNFNSIFQVVFASIIMSFASKWTLGKLFQLHVIVSCGISFLIGILVYGIILHVLKNQYMLDMEEMIYQKVENRRKTQNV